MVRPSRKSQTGLRPWTWSLGIAATSELHPSVANGTEWKLVAALTHLAARRKCPQWLSTACLFEFGHLFLATTLFLAGASLNLSRPGSEWSLLKRRHAKRQQAQSPKYHFAKLHSPPLSFQGMGGTIGDWRRSLIICNFKTTLRQNAMYFFLQNYHKNAAFCRLRSNVVWKGDWVDVLCRRVAKLNTRGQK